MLPFTQGASSGLETLAVESLRTPAGPPRPVERRRSVRFSRDVEELKDESQSSTLPRTHIPIGFQDATRRQVSEAP